MRLLLNVSRPLKICSAIVARVAVDVIHRGLAVWVGYKCKSDQSVNQFGFPEQCDANVSMRVDGMAHDSRLGALKNPSALVSSAPNQSANTAKVADLIAIIKAWDRPPFFHAQTATPLTEMVNA